MLETVLHVVGARPNLVKVAPLMREMSKMPERFRQVLVHTGQHYDDTMSRIFFQDLAIPDPDVNLDVGSGSQASQTANIMLRLEQALLEYRPDLVVVYGDANSTLAAALTAAKLELPVAHVEAGLRSFDRAMPEETNRVVTDHISDLLFTPSKDADANLEREGVDSRKVHFVGNVMIDTLQRMLSKSEDRRTLERLGLTKEGVSGEAAPVAYVVATLHRPSNVDDSAALTRVLEGLATVAEHAPVVFPVHPRTRKALSEIQADASRINMIDPLGYLDFLCLIHHASVVVTDSGGVQEETTYLRVPCLTVRKNTERPVTITQGTNRLVDDDQLADQVLSRLDAESDEVIAGPPELWDGRAAERIARVLADRRAGATASLDRSD